jgi:hypothetical protein
VHGDVTGSGAPIQRVVYFMLDAVRQATLAHDEVRKPRESMSDEVRVMLAASAVLSLAALKEGAAILAQMKPVVFAEIPESLKADIERWAEFRHDIAHPAGPNPNSDVFEPLLQYDDATDTLSGGKNHAIVLGYALGRAGAFVKHVGNTWMTAISAGLLARPREYASVTGEMLCRGFLRLKDDRTMELAFDDDHPLVKPSTSRID